MAAALRRLTKGECQMPCSVCMAPQLLASDTETGARGRENQLKGKVEETRTLREGGKQGRKRKEPSEIGKEKL